MQQTTGEVTRIASSASVLPPALRVMDVLARIPELGAVPADQRLLLTAEGILDPALPPVAAWAVYRIPVTASGAAVPRRFPPGHAAPGEPLPFADEAFEAVCLYGALRQVVQQPRLLNKVRRMLRSGGRVVVVEPLASFNFTTFPIGGPAQLLRRQLLQAGFQRVRALAGTDELLVFLADRALAANPIAAHA